jgi:hypothetical protein
MNAEHEMRNNEVGSISLNPRSRRRKETRFHALVAIHASRGLVAELGSLTNPVSPLPPRFPALASAPSFARGI